MNDNRAFTLIELLAVIVILGIVVAIAIPGINSVISNSRKKSVMSEAQLIHSAAIRKLAEDPNFDFSVVNQNNAKHYLETEDSGYDELYIFNDNGKISVTLKKYGIKANTDGKTLSSTNLIPHIAFEYDFSLGTGFVNIQNSELTNGVHIYKGTYYENLNKIKSDIKKREKGSANYFLTNLKWDTELREKLNVSTGIYTVVATKFTETMGPLSESDYHPASGINYLNHALIRVPNFDIVELNTTNLSSMFTGATNFNYPIGYWDTSKVTDMSRMFYKAKSFNQNINNWNTSNVENMIAMFRDINYNQPLNNLDVSQVKYMTHMFSGNKTFNHPLNNWDVSNVTRTRSMFYGAHEFNQDISNWNTSNIHDMSYMFSTTLKFNQDISNWDVSKVEEGYFDPWNDKFYEGYSMEYMFRSAESFNQDLSKWNVSKLTEKPQAFDYSTPNWIKPKPIWGTNGGN